MLTKITLTVKRFKLIKYNPHQFFIQYNESINNPYNGIKFAILNKLYSHKHYLFGIGDGNKVPLY
jgi:hypothetical protein